MDENEIPDIVRQARRFGNPGDEARYVDTCAAVLKQCSSCGSARKHCSCGRSADKGLDEKGQPMTYWGGLSNKGQGNE